MSAQPQRAYLSRPETARSSNEHIVGRAVQLRFVSRVPLLCECSDESCRELLLLGVRRYREARRQGDYLTAPGHLVEGATATLRERDLWLHRRAA